MRLPPAPVATAGIVLFATVLAASGGQERAVATDQTREPVLGLLEIPDLIGGGCGAMPQKPLDLFNEIGAPTPRGALGAYVRGRSADGASCQDAAIVLRVPGGAPVEALTEESDYEVRSLVVYERSGEWFRVALRPGSGWVRVDRKNFLPYPDLLLARLAYLRKGWNGTIWDEPGSGPGEPVPREWRPHLADDVNVTVLAVRHVGTAAWIQVRLETERCGETISGVDPVSGWIPAYAPAGRPAAWFYSRGC